MLSSVSLVGGVLSLSSFAQSTPVQAHAEMVEMQQAEDAWGQALTKRDQYGLENVLSAQLVDIAATGEVTTRNQDISKLFVKGALPESLKQTVVDVRTLSGGTKVVTGTYVMHWVAAGSSAPSVDEKGVFTHVLQQVNGRWIFVNSQRTVVAEQGPVVKTKTVTVKPKSNAPEPFHIPLVYKGAQSAPASAPVPQK